MENESRRVRDPLSFPVDPPNSLGLRLLLLSRNVIDIYTQCGVNLTQVIKLRKVFRFGRAIPAARVGWRSILIGGDVYYGVSTAFTISRGRISGDGCTLE